MRLQHGQPPELSEREREDAMRVGEMVQLANITRDIEKDLRRGIAYDLALKVIWEHPFRRSARRTLPRGAGAAAPHGAHTNSRVRTHHRSDGVACVECGARVGGAHAAVHRAVFPRLRATRWHERVGWARLRPGAASARGSRGRLQSERAAGDHPRRARVPRRIAGSRPSGKLRLRLRADVNRRNPERQGCPAHVAESRRAHPLGQLRRRWEERD